MLSPLLFLIPSTWVCCIFTASCPTMMSEPPEWDIVLPPRDRRRNRKWSRPTSGASSLATTTTFDDDDTNNDNIKANVSTSSVLLLVGLPGSGKSTLAEALCRARPHRYVRVNQDTLGNRKKCVQLARRTLLQNGQCPIIDRCNASVSQRQHWTALAQEVAGGAPVDCVVLDVSDEECWRRCQCRQNHPTLPPHQARGIIRVMQREWQMPSAPVEGFRSVTIVQQKDQEDLPNLVDRLLRLVET